MPKFVFHLHDDAEAEPNLLAEMLESNLAAEAFGRPLLVERPAAIAVEVYSEETRITTIKQLGRGHTASTPAHTPPA